MRQSSLVTIRAAEDGFPHLRAVASAGEPRLVVGQVVEPTLTLRSPLPATLASYEGSATERLCFDQFILAPRERLLTKDRTPIDLGGRSFDLLLALVEQAGRVIPKRELIQRVWPDVTVEEVALRFHMTRLRKALGDGRGGCRLITTQVGVGYGFVGVVKRAEVSLARPPLPRDVRPETLLPSRLDRLIGRERDLRSVVERVASVRLLTIVGPPGVGKTSLAVEATHELASGFADGATFVDLAAVKAPDMLVPAIAKALGLTTAANIPMTLVLDHLRDRRQLLVLDNGEHLVQAAAWACEQIVSAAPGVRVIATSRQALRARNEQVQRLLPFEAPAAVDLFMHHLSTAGGEDAATSSGLRTISEICRRLDGLALPIELAAMRAATHGIDATSRMLGDPHSLSWPGRRTAPPHQRTLQASLDWSFDLLSGAAHQVFDRLSRLEGPFSLETALEAAVDGALDSASAAAALDELADKSLIQSHADGYRFFETMRLYAGYSRAGRGRSA